jgi:hypothetical protein
MTRPLIDAILLWLMLAFSVLYMLEMPWRQWRNRPPKIWMPLWAEFLLPLSYILLAAGGQTVVVMRVFTAGFMIAGLLFRLVIRKRLGIPAWPPV